MLKPYKPRKCYHDRDAGLKAQWEQYRKELEDLKQKREEELKAMRHEYEHYETKLLVDANSVEKPKPGPKPVNNQITDKDTSEHPDILLPNAVENHM